MQLNNLEQTLEKEPRFRFKQINDAVYKNFIEDWSDVSNLPKNLISKLQENCPIDIKAEMISDQGGNTKKAVIELKDGSKIETVLMRNKQGKNTVCVSSQVGCPVACSFCATGQMGFKRNLIAEEIIEQVLFFARTLKKEDSRIDRIVFMGMGEPFLNWEEVKKTIKTLNDQNRFNIGYRHISVSTIGITNGIRSLAKEFPQINLAVSIHSGADKRRTELVRINEKYNLKRIQRAVEHYLETTNRKVFFEYVMIDGLNDKEENAKELVQYIVGFDKRHLIHVNLIVYNKTPVEFKASSKENLDKFKNILEKAHIDTTIRKSFGGDLAGACGQLATSFDK